MKSGHLRAVIALFCLCCRRAAAAVLLFVAIGELMLAAHAAGPLDQQTIRIVIAHKAGNTTDTMARLFAQTMKRYLPDTSINIQNVDGSGGTLAMNELNGAKGSLVTIGFVNSSVIFTQVTLGEQLPYNLKDFHWIGALASSQRVLVVRKDALDRADPGRRSDGAPLLSLAMSASAHNYIDGLLLNSTTHLRLRMVPGFKTGQQNAMLLSGDSDAGIGTYGNFREFIASGDVVPVLKFGTVGYPDDLKDLPTLGDVVLPDADPDVVAVATRLSDMGRFVVAAPATSAAQRDALVAVFAQVVADPDYLAALESAKLVGTPSNADAASALVHGLLADSAVQEKLRAAIACGQQISDQQRQTCD